MARKARPGVGRASVKKATVAKFEREGRKLRSSLRSPATDAGVRRRASAKKSTAARDAFQNFGLNIGMGTNNALSQSQYGFYPITRVRTLLDWIYRGSWFGNLAVDLPAEDMTRGGIEILTVEDPKSVEKMNQALVRLQIWQKLCETIKWSRLYGGCVAIVLVEGQDPETPLRVETVGRNKFKGLMVLDKWMIEPDLSHLVSELGPSLGLPEFYRVTGDAPAFRNKKIHYTRCIRLIGVPLPWSQAVMENLWGLSVFERLYDRMVAFDSATMGAAQLVYKSFIRTYKMDGLHDAAAAGGDSLMGVHQRVELMRKYQGIEGVTLIDKEDDFATHESGGFSGIADILLHFAEQFSGSLQIPLVRMLGQSPAGLNSSGESDLRTYYDNILQQQERNLRDGVNLVLRVLAMSLGIQLPDNFNFNFVPLWQLNETEKSDVADKITRMVLEAEAAGLISQKVALMELRQLSRITGKWTNITDEMIAEASDVAAPPEMEGEGESTGDPDSPAESPEPGSAEAEVEGLEKFRRVRHLVGGADARTRDFYAYSVPYTEIGGIQVAVEQRAGSIRRGRGWSVVMPADYGYIRRVGSAEGPEEWLDCFVGPDHSSRKVWVIDTLNPKTGRFDEHKVMLGFRSSRDALTCFKMAYDDGAAHRIGAVNELSMDDAEWKEWLASGDKSEPMAPELMAA